MGKVQIEDLIPYGQENAITRSELLKQCMYHSVCCDDRTMRALIMKSREGNVIINSTTGGYYRPTHDDIPDLRRYINQEESRAVSIHKDLKRAKALYSDYMRGAEV